MFVEHYLNPWEIRVELLLATLFGVASHLLFYIRGEHHLEAPILFWSHTVAFLILCYANTTMQDIYRGSIETAAISRAYFVGLMGSIITYRRFFHRLRHFPGPALAGISKLWHTVKCLNSQNHILLDSLHKEYGDVVRTGPTEVTIFLPEVKWAVDGPLNKCQKAVWYDILKPLVALNTNRSKKEHDQRRRAWDQAITVQTLPEYESRLQNHVLLLDKHIASSTGQPINVTDWFYFLAFDVMGDFAFSKSFNMLVTKDWHYAVVLLRRALGLLGPFSSVPWLARLAFSMPVIPVIRNWNYMLSWCAARMEEQVITSLNAKPIKPNISSWLVGHSIKKGTLARDSLLLKGDAVALIVAGSDTVAFTMTSMFYRLALHPEHAAKIRAEIDTLTTVHDSQGLKTLPHMNGAINEVLRLHPSVPTGGYRESPPEGMNIGGIYIPGNVTIVAPRYTIGRLPRLYERPCEFIPERWYSSPELVKDKTAFNPFSIGRYSCVGKHLALAEIRFTTAWFLKKYDITFAPGEDGSTVWKHMKDNFTAVPGELNLVFSLRKRDG